MWIHKHVFCGAALLALSFTTLATADGEILLVGCPCQSHASGGFLPGAGLAAEPAPFLHGGSGYFPAPALGMHPRRVTPPVAPPPGTLGRTYRIPSEPIPAEKHPRVGMLDVRTSGAVEILVISTNEFREEDSIDGYQDAVNANLWRFETKPLIPGIPHVYRIEVYTSDDREAPPTTVRYVRLIPGRILTLTI